ncbi:L-rhamnose/proton symporter RhaT [Fangia hongkongensis]|uniref:L-rhamnose/proton symporter RhaT n=1 Tax=Fangia hongkongensis TaxID=270495 RepID=UPI0003659E34|nr:L-rhamnose/proton symporter RhaT [Fangia hongkongensis]MBK2125587.1 hypothetical protein [Fangia hongkongensis]
MSVSIAVVFALIAGVFNGSFTAPSKYIHSFSHAKIWLLWCFFGLFFVPMLITVFSGSDVLYVLTNTPIISLLTLFVGGVIYGIGLIFFILSFHRIGIALGFIINVGTGTVLASLFGLLSVEDASSRFIIFQMIGLVLFIIGMLFSIISGKLREREKQAQDIKHTGRIIHKKGAYFIGIIFALLAGVASAVEGISFSLGISDITKSVANTSYSTVISPISIPWFIMCIGMFIPFFIYFCYRNIKQMDIVDEDKSKRKKINTGMSYFYTLIMGLLFFLALISYGLSTRYAGVYTNTIAWPTFMIFIILTSNFWGWLQGEWRGASKLSAMMLIVSLVIFIIAEVFFSFSSI